LHYESQLINVVGKARRTCHAASAVLKKASRSGGNAGHEFPPKGSSFGSRYGCRDAVVNPGFGPGRVGILNMQARPLAGG
jgi:hypothetical protein